MKSILIDYEGLASSPEKAMKRLVDAFQKAGLSVLKAESNGRNLRKAGVSYREAVVTFEDSQQVTLSVKGTGDVFEVKLNGKVIPIKNQDDHAAAVAELARKLDTGRAAFQKRMAAVAMKPPPGIRTAAPKLRDALIAQIAEVDQAIDGAQKELAALTA